MNNLIRWTLFYVLSVFSPTLLALGLGGAEVESYLDQPLDVRIELISQSKDELESVTAGLASVQDFELLGMNRAAITVPLEFELVTDTASPYIHITSDLKVNEPVVQVLVEVVWASGRMLREYTLFLDPPTFDSPAPPVKVRQESKSLPEPVVENSTAMVQREKEPRLPEPVQDSSEDAVAEPVKDAAEDAAEPDAAEDSPAQQVADEDEWIEDGEVYGPVARGETLWGIARDFSRGSGYSINQAMLAMQRKNPDAFIKNNINSLKRGAILRVPTFNEMGELTSRQAMLEVMRQEEEARTGIRSVAPDYSTPTVADSGDYQATVAEQVEPVVAEEESGHLELIPPSEEVVADDTVSEDIPDPSASAELIKEQLSRTEEELVNAKQENTYLSERIKELESQVAEQSEQTGTVEDSELANLESSLAEQRAEDKPETPVAMTPGGESRPWYAGNTFLLIAMAVVLIALIIWTLRRRSASRLESTDNGPVAALAVEAEEILKTLHTSDDEETVVQPAPEPELDARLDKVTYIEDTPVVADDEGETVVQAGTEDVPFIADEEGETVVQALPESDTGFVIDFADEGDDQVEDEAGQPEDDDVQPDSDDNPEIKLDLARAYMSLGDKEASKSMLDEVLKSGNEEQRAEAQQMLDEL